MAKKVLQLRTYNLPVENKGLKGKRRNLFLILPTFLMIFLCASDSKAKPLQIAAKARKTSGYARTSSPDRPDSLRKKGAYIPGEVLVFVEEDIDENDMNKSKSAARDIDSAVRGTVRKRIRLSRRKGPPGKRRRRRRQEVLRVKLVGGKTVEQAIAEKWSRNDPRIKFVEPNYRVKNTAVPNDSYFGQMWGLYNTGQNGGTAGFDIGAPEAWDITTGSSDVIVGIIDTGIDYRHPDLVDNIWINPGEIADNGIDDDGNGYIDDVYGYDFFANDSNPMDENDHGTHVAGTIAARGNNNLGVAGVNWSCRVIACRFLDADGNGAVSDAIEAVNYAVANGAKILNNSWGWEGSPSLSLERAIVNARDNGVLFVASAGNEDSDNDQGNSYPACYEISNVIAVAATDRYGHLAGFSNYGQQSVHLGAPGVSISSTIRNGDYALFNGTSMAAPHVSGAAGLLLAYYPDITLGELKARIISTGNITGSLQGSTISGRHLNAYNALTAPAGITIFAPRNGQNWQRGRSYTISYSSIGQNDTVDIYLLKDGCINSHLSEDIANTGSFDWLVPGDLPLGSDYSILIEGPSPAESNGYFNITENQDFVTEYFDNSSDLFDLSDKSVLFTPNNSNGYHAVIEDIDYLPQDPADDERLVLGDDDYRHVTLNNQSVVIFGESFDGFYVGSNGYITFTNGQGVYSPSLFSHFSRLRISGLFEDLNPGRGGAVSWRQTENSAVVTWRNVPEYGRNNSNTFQVEMYFDGRIRLTWLDVAAQTGLVGLSGGLGIDAAFEESDFSDYPQRKGPIGHWKFNQGNGTTTNDSSGYNNNATLVNGAVLSDEGYVELDGADDAVEISTMPWDVNKGTVTLWIYAEQFNGKSYLFGHSTDENSNRIQLYTVSNMLCMGLGNSAVTRLDIERLKLQTWTHIALTWDETHYVVYVDGVEKAAGSYSGLWELNTFADIGNNANIFSRNEAFDGIVDEVRVYDRALAGYEVSNLFNLDLGDRVISESTALHFQINAVNANGESLNYNAHNLPPGAVFSDNKFRWRPWYDQEGKYEVPFVQEKDLAESETITITVRDVELSSWYKRWIEHMGLEHQ
ncbi:MAG: S8 family serine peptidase [Planctomycetota bacterium]|jgi:subtilisin family serine protease